MLNRHGLLTVLLVSSVIVMLICKARAGDDCPPRVDPSQVNCDEARGYVAAIGLQESMKRARRCGYSLSDIVATIRRCGLK